VSADEERTDHWRGNGQPTLGEVHRSLHDLIRRFDRLSEDLQSAALGHVAQGERIRVLERDVAAIQASQTWAWRTVAASMFTAVTSLAVALIVWMLNR
jgi:hypothetical protein